MAEEPALCPFSITTPLETVQTLCALSRIWVAEGIMVPLAEAVEAEAPVPPELLLEEPCAVLFAAVT